MVSIRTAKSKGSQFEYDVQASLAQKYPEIYRTSERGFQRQYDLHIPETEQYPEIAIECKRHASFSWNQLYGYFIKLIQKSNLSARQCYLVFRPNRQPCLVMCMAADGISISDFNTTFGVPFIKHESTRAKN